MDGLRVGVAAARKSGELGGLRVGVTAARKGDELATLLQRRGADVTWGPTLAADRPAAAEALRDETVAVLVAQPAWVVVSTGVGVRTWLEAARECGLEARLLGLLLASKAVARGIKAAGALRHLSVDPVFVSPQETAADVVAWLAGQVAPAEAVAIQLHGGAGDAAAYRPLMDGAVRLLFTSPYRCDRPDDCEPARRLVRAVVAGEVDAVVATSPPAVRGLLAIAGDLGLEAALTEALRSSVAAAAIGPVTAAAFEQHGVPVAITPKQPRLGELVRAIAGWWTLRPTTPADLLAGGIELLPESRVARLGTRAVVLGAVEFGVLAALVRRAYVACPFDLLAREAWGHRPPDDLTAVKHTVSRLRRKLGPTGRLIQAVPNVGYRYAPASPAPAVRATSAPRSDR